MPQYRGVVVVMGAPGCGKTTVGKALAQALGCPFIEGDDLHSPEAVAKMTAGAPLTTEDRLPWLERVGKTCEAAARESGCAVAACSALTRSYRDVLRQSCTFPVIFVHLNTDPEILRRRVRDRKGHFMPPILLESQLAILEPLDESERGITLAMDAAPSDIVDKLAEDLLRGAS